MLPVVSGAFSHEVKLECIFAGKTPCGVGSVNGHNITFMRDTGSTACVVKRSVVKAELTDAKGGYRKVSVTGGSGPAMIQGYVI